MFVILNINNKTNGIVFFTQEVAIDLGTANTIITCNDKMVVDEPSVIALDARSDKVLAVGKVAREMYEKTHPNIRTVRPLREGSYRDFYAAEQNDSRALSRWRAEGSAGSLRPYVW